MTAIKNLPNYSENDATNKHNQYYRNSTPRFSPNGI